LGFNSIKSKPRIFPVYEEIQEEKRYNPNHFMFIYGYTDRGFSVPFPQLQGKCQGKTRKDGTQFALFLIFVLFYVFLYCSMYFCVVLCIFVLFYVLFVLCRLCVYVYCTTATGWLPNCS
jgi:hypothetical protein